jgi:uncharacterized protein (DUF58 family)
LAGLLFPLGSVVIPDLYRLLPLYDGALILLAIVTSKLVPKASLLRVRRRYDQVLSVRVRNRVELEIENESNVPLIGTLRDVIPDGFEATQTEFPVHLEPHEVKVLSYHVTPPERGKGIFGNIFLRVTAPLGLVAVDRELPASESVPVYPNILRVKEFGLLRQRGQLNQMGIRRSRIKGRGSEFESLRDYHADDMRLVDWKSTARRGKLVVRDYETERNQNVIVMLDVSRHMLPEVEGTSKLDHAIDAALILLHAATLEGDATGLVVFSNVVHRLMTPRRGKLQRSQILNALHDLDPQAVEVNYEAAFSQLMSRWKRRSLIVIFTDAEDEKEGKALVRALGMIGRRHLVLVCRISDPYVKELAKVRLEKPKDLFDNAAALWYTEERMRAEVALAGAGIRSMDSEPQDLAQDLVSAYLHVKDTAAL